MNVIILGGLGLVGTALKRALSKSADVFILDKRGTIGNIPSEIGFLHVAIPHSEEFVSVVRRVASTYQPERIIVHSTVPIGTTRAIGMNTAHSPIVGQHNALVESVKRFDKWLGVTTPADQKAFVTHLKRANLRVLTMPSPESTEACKLLCLSRYLNDLAFYETAEQILSESEVLPGEFIRWNTSYNKGYAGTQFVRPEFYFPQGRVGGNCVLKNSKMLYQQTGNQLLKRNIDLFEAT